MIFNNEFAVELGIDRAWELLTDLATIAPCLPGAELVGVEDGTFTGTMLVKVGPMTAKYSGTAVLQDADESIHQATILARGMDTRGAGPASAMIVTTLRPADGRTLVAVNTDLRISGRFAQFGGGVLQQVAGSVLDQFAENLQARFSVDSVDAPSPPTAVPVAPLSAWQHFRRWVRRLFRRGPGP